VEKIKVKRFILFQISYFRKSVVRKLRVKDIVSNIWNGHLPLYSPTWWNITMIMCLVTSHSKFLYELWQVHQELGNRLITYIGMMKEKFWKTSQPNSFLKKSKKKIYNWSKINHHNTGFSMSGNLNIQYSRMDHLKNSFSCIGIVFSTVIVLYLNINLRTSCRIGNWIFWHKRIRLLPCTL